eukprot:4620016-Prymnesium_polylepis.1
MNAIQQQVDVLLPLRAALALEPPFLELGLELLVLQVEDGVPDLGYPMSAAGAQLAARAQRGHDSSQVLHRHALQVVAS